MKEVSKPSNNQTLTMYDGYGFLSRMQSIGVIIY